MFHFHVFITYYYDYLATLDTLDLLKLIIIHNNPIYFSNFRFLLLILDTIYLIRYIIYFLFHSLDLNLDFLYVFYLHLWSLNCYYKYLIFMGLGVGLGVILYFNFIRPFLFYHFYLLKNIIKKYYYFRISHFIIDDFFKKFNY